MVWRLLSTPAFVNSKHTPNRPQNPKSQITDYALLDRLAGEHACRSALFARPSAPAVPALF